jgi:hypothetical protein
VAKFQFSTIHGEMLIPQMFNTTLFYVRNSRIIRWAGRVARMGEKRNAYGILVGNPEGKSH